MTFKTPLITIIFLLFGIIIGFAQTPDNLLKGPAGTKQMDFEIIKSNNSVKKIPQQNIYSKLPIEDDLIDLEPENPEEPYIPPKPPTTASQAGTTPAQLSVSLTGAAVYNIPISIPPGIKDIKPHVGLSFSSQAANGLAGWGWNVSGLSTISRIPSTKFHDNEIDGIDFDNKDRFALDGQRLLLKSGSYGASNSQYQTENYSNLKIIAYGTSPYGSAYGPSYFVVFYPNGERAWYGNSGNSRGRLEWAIYKWQDPQGNYIQYNYTQSNGLLRINDIKYGAKGSTSSPNIITFYYKTRTRSELSYIGGQTFKRTNILEKVEVRGKGQLYRKYVLEHQKTTSLGYQLLTKVTESNSQNMELSPIQFTYEVPTQDGLVKYPNSHSIYPGISYDKDLMVSGEFNGDGKMDFLTFNKTSKNKLNIFTNIFDNSGFSLGYGVNVTSFDGVFASNILSWNGKLLPQQAITTASETIVNTKGVVKFSTFAMAPYGPVFQYEKTWNASTYNYEYSCNSSVRKKIPKEYISGDFNGDGLTDVIAITKAYTSKYCNQPDPDCDSGGGGITPPMKMEQSNDKSKLNTTNSSAKLKDLDVQQRIAPIDDPIDCPCNCSTYTSTNSLAYFIDLDRTKTSNFVFPLNYLQSQLKDDDQMLAADFNGDGKSDLFHFTEGKLFVYGFNNNSLQLLYSTTDSYIKMDRKILLGDYNGDGKTDFAVPTANNTSTWRFYLANGSTYYVYSKNIGVYYQDNYVYSGSKNVNGVSMSNPLYEFHYIAQDFNGDGKSDVLRHEVVSPYSSYSTVSEKIQLYVNKFTSTDYTPSFQLTTTQQQNNNGLTKFGIPVFLDVTFTNGNLEYAYIDGNNVYAYEFSKDHRIDVSLKSISNNGIVTNILYEKLSGGYYNSYTPDYNENYPNININVAPSLTLVRTFNETGEGITRSQEFQYKGAVTNTQGLGFLGFKVTKKSNWFGDNVPKLWNITTQNPELRGAITRQWISESSSDSPDNFTTKTDYTYDTQLLSNKVFVNLPTTVVKNESLQGYILTQTNSYDAYNNPTDVHTSYPGGSKNVSYTYIHNLTSTSETYHIGRLTKKVETSTLGGEMFTTEEQYTYNNNLITKTLKAGNGTGWLTENTVFDSFGNTTQKSISGSGVATRLEKFEYDSSGRFLTKLINTEGLSTLFTYNYNNGNLLTTTTPHGLKTTFEYDGWNRLSRKTDYLNNSTYITYTPVTGGGYKKLTNYAQGQDEEVTYNAFGLITKSKVLRLNNKWVQKSFEYDLLGRKKRESEPYFSTGGPSWWNSTTYDSFGRPVSLQSFTGKVTDISYNGLSVTINDGSKTVTTTKDVAGNTIRVQDDGGLINYTYFANGSMKTANYGDHIVSTNIDGWGRKIKLTDPSAGTYTYEYNILGELLVESTPKGETNYTYDSFGKVTSKNITGENTSLNLSYAYNGSSKLLEVINGSDTGNQKTYLYTYEYDNYKRPTKIIESNDLAYFEKQVAYDSYGNPYKETYYSKNVANAVSNTIKIRNVYNNAGILYEIQNFDTSEQLWKLTNENERGNPLSIALGNGLTKSREYDQFGFLTKINDFNSSNNSYVLKMDYSFNSQKGTLNSRKNHSFNWLENFTYDNLNRLTNVTGAVTFTQNYDTRGRITDNNTIGQYTYENSNKYRLKDISLNTAGDTYYNEHSLQQISYNAFKMPVDIFEENKGRVSFEYSPLGNRSHAYYGGLNEEKIQRNFFKHYSAISPVEIVENKVNNTTKIITYIGGDAYSAPIVYITNTKSGSSNGYHYLHRDYLGSILAITNAAGIAKEKRQFGAWGVVDKFVDDTGNTIFDESSLIARGYSGHEHFFEVSLIHMNGRLYDAKLGRFLSPDNFIQDPFSTQSYNRYGYVWNNPLMYTDPSGEFIFMAAIIVGAVVGAYFGGAQANGSYNPLKWNWSSGSTWLGVLGGAAIGAVATGIGIYASTIVAPLLSSAGITGGILGYGIPAAAAGLASGAFSGGLMSQLPGGNGDFWGSALKGAVIGAGTGFFLGGAVGAFKTPAGHSIWTGKSLMRPTVENISSVAKGISKIDNGLNNVREAIPDAGPVKYKAEYLYKVEGLDGQHVWNRQSIEIVADHGKVFNIIGGDKSTHTLIQHLGSHKGTDGVFELILNNGLVTHQRFIPGGIITGFPNQVVPGISPSVPVTKPWW